MPAAFKFGFKECGTQAMAISGPINRAPRAMAFASLCPRASAADSGSATCAQRHAGLRLAAIATPIPEPHTVMPRSAWPSANASASMPHIRIIDAFVAVGTEIEHLVALIAEPAGNQVLEVDAGMIGGKGDAHDR